MIYTVAKGGYGMYVHSLYATLKGTNSLAVPHHAFPDNTPVFLPKSKLADFIESYIHFQELPIWTSTALQPGGAKFDPSKKRWSVTLNKEGKEVTLYPKHLVLATGVLDKPIIPQFNGMEKFGGEMMHSKEFKNAKAWKGKKVTIIGVARFLFTHSGMNH